MICLSSHEVVFVVVGWMVDHHAPRLPTLSLSTVPSYVSGRFEEIRFCLAVAIDRNQATGVGHLISKEQSGPPLSRSAELLP